MSILVIGDWEDIYEGHCAQFEHHQGRNSATKHPSSVIQDLDTFATLLQETEPISVQITSEAEQSLDKFYGILSTVGKICPTLQCLGIHLTLSTSEEEEWKKECVDIELDDVQNQEDLSPNQTACTSAWLDFLNSVKPTLQHIAVCGSLSTPSFAVKILLEDCPNFDILNGEFSRKHSILTAFKDEESNLDFASLADEKRNLILSAQLARSFVPYDFTSLGNGFKNMRVCSIDWRFGMDLSFFASPDLTKLNTVYLRNTRIQGGEDGEVEPVGPNNQVHVVDIAFPENSRLIELSLIGIDLSQDSWNNLGQRTLRLKWISTSACGKIEPANLEPLRNLPKLEVIWLEAENNLRGRDLAPLFFSSSGKFRLCLKIHLKQNNIEQNDEIEETVLNILDCLNNEKADLEERMEGGVGVDIEYWNHKGGFDYLKEAVEAKGFKFEMEANKWKCFFEEENYGERYFRLSEGKQIPVCE